MSIYVTYFLEWSDMSLEASLAAIIVSFVSARTMSGNALSSGVLAQYKPGYPEILSVPAAKLVCISKLKLKKIL